MNLENTDFRDHCRVCEQPEKHSNIFYNINKELLVNLIELVQYKVEFHNLIYFS